MLSSVVSIACTRQRGSPRCQLVHRSQRISPSSGLRITSCRHCGSTACTRCHAAQASMSCVAPCVPRIRKRSRRRTSWQSRRATRISIRGADGHARISPMTAPPSRPVSWQRWRLSSATCSQRSVVRGRHSRGQGEGTPNSSKSCQSIVGNVARNPGKHALLPEPLAPVTMNIIAAFALSAFPAKP
jgi:hypothetical protein